MGKLKKNSSVALYQQLADDIKSQIQSGELMPGDQIMTEIELSAMYDVSRITVRNAIQILVDDGILIRQQGKGTFVAEQKRLSRDMGIFMGFTQSCILDGKKPSTRVLTEELVPARPSDVRDLHLQEGEKVIRIVRLRYCDDIPVVLEENRFPQGRYLFLLGEDLTGSLYEILERHKIVVAGGSRRIGISFATEEECGQDRLNVPLKEPLLLMNDICVNMDGEPVHSCRSVINSRHYNLFVRERIGRENR